MRNLTIGDLDLGLRDLFSQRKAALDASMAGKIYGPQLAAARAAIEALPEALDGSRPKAAQLGEADDQHDGFGAGLWHYTEAVLSAPDATDATRASAQRIRDAFIPQRSTLADSYAEEAAAAKKNRPKLAELEQELKAFPLPGGKTLHDWAKGLLDAGDTLDKLLSERSSLEAAASKSPASKLRGSTIGLLCRFRDALRDEMKGNNALPADIEGQVFSYFDELSARRRTGKAKGDGKAAGETIGGAQGGG
jgi:hypothetical protein